jgi:hypothetical protein
VRRSQAFEDFSQVVVNCPWAQEELCSDLGVREPATRERGPAPPDPLTFSAPDAADTGDTILHEAAGIAVRGRVTQPPESPIRLGARGRVLLRGAN